MRLSKKFFFAALFLCLILLVGEFIRIKLKDNNLQTQTSENNNPFAGLVSKPVSGSQVPKFELADSKGGKVSITDFKGKAVVLNFWATWCAPCKLEMPLFQKLTGSRVGDVVVLAVNNKESADMVNAYAKENKVTFPLLLDSDGKVAGKFGVYAYPSTFFIDKEGIIQSQHTGQIDAALLTKYLKTIGIDAW
jgi:cytochrome c biogenesis protein CcmG, thiol:disulfide interchange protein DsbE